jgi:hypothetical protein
MEFLRVRLRASRDRMSALRQFYTETLGLRRGGVNAYAIGVTELEFEPGAGEPFYHFALLVPGDRFDASLAWADERVHLLPGGDFKDIVSLVDDLEQERRMVPPNPLLVRKQSKLALQTQIVNLVPVGDNLTVAKMLDLELLHLDRPPGRRHPKELPAVRASHGHPQRRLVLAEHHVLNRVVNIREGVPHGGDGLLQALWSFRQVRQWGAVVHVVGCDELIADIETPLVPDLIVVADNDRARPIVLV